MNRRKSLAVVLVAGVLMAGFTGTTASAASVSWSTACAEYTGYSSYNTSTGVGFASTTANDNDEVGVAIRYYGGQTAYTTGYGYKSQSRAAALNGGNHQSYCFPGTQTRLSTI